MSTFGQMEAEWRDQQSGARDQQYDEEQLNECEDEPSAGIDRALAMPQPIAPGFEESKQIVLHDQRAGEKGALQKDVA